MKNISDEKSYPYPLLLNVGTLACYASKKTVTLVKNEDF